MSLSIYNKVKEPAIIHTDRLDITMVDNDYKWLQIAFENQNFWLTAMYDNEDKLIELYFDITKNNYLDDINNAYYDDLFTDIIVTSNGEINIIDEDELELALKEKIITYKDYVFAKTTTKKLFEYIKLNKNKIIEDCFS